ncbi:MAG: hypothetical protein ACE5HD_10885 [Acidobacteriota bacterium]
MKVSRRRLPGRVAAGLAAFLCAGLSWPLSAPPAPAFPPQTRTAGWPPGAGTIRRPPVVVPAVSLTRATPADPHLGSFVTEHPRWWCASSPLTGSVARAFGPGLGLPGLRSLPPEERLDLWLAAHPDLLGPPLAELGHAHRLAGPAGEGAVTWLEVEQHHAGLPVLGAGLSVAVRDQRIVYLASQALAKVTASPVAALGAAAARSAVAAFLGGGTVLQDLEPPHLAYVVEAVPAAGGQHLRHRLVWAFLLRPQGAPEAEAHHAWVDGRTGEVVALYPEALDAGGCRSDPARLQGVVSGGIRPNGADDAEVVRGFPAAKVVDGEGVKTTDRNGSFPFGRGPASSSLGGVDFDLTCARCCPCDPLPRAAADGGGRIAFGTGGGSAGDPVSGNGTSTPAERTSFFHLEEARRLLEKWNVANLPTIRVQTNVNQTCNALSGEYWLRFFQADATCRNPGEVRGLIQHELGHAWDRFDGNGTFPDSLSEWKADMLALLMSGDSCIGGSFRLDPATWPTAACSGLRDVDEKAAGRTDHPPTPGECATCATLTAADEASCAGDPHCVGEIPGQAVWHLLRNLRTGTDGITGLPLAGDNPGLSAAQARWLLEKLLLAGGPPMTHWNPAATGVSVYDAVMVAHDDDLDLGNGAPYGAYINAAFLHHGLAENVLIGDSPDCIPPPDPVVTARVERNPESGRPRVRLDWGRPVGHGAGRTRARPERAAPLDVHYDVFRTSRDGDAFLPVIRGVDAGPVLDENVRVGETWSYFVAAVPAASCAMISPGENLATVAIDLPEVRVAGMVLNDAAGGDGDGQLEPGETAAVEVALGETGGRAGGTGLAATLESLDPFVSVAFAGPLSYGDLEPGGTVSAAGSFQVTLAPDAACGGPRFLSLAITGDHDCWSDGLLLPVGGAPCDTFPGAFVRPVPGSLRGRADSGDGDGIPDNCEITTFSYRLANVGQAPSGPVTATVASRNGAARVSSGAVVTVPSLDPGEEFTAVFKAGVAGALSGQALTFRVAAEAAARPGAAVVEFQVRPEEDPVTYGDLVFDFESGAQGWSADGFRLSRVHAASGLQSFRGGRRRQPWLCQRLTSPVIRLAPGSHPSMNAQIWVDVQPFSAGQWRDRANVHLLEEDTGAEVLLEPAAGLRYNVDPAATGLAPICRIDREAGWAADLAPFAVSTFDLSPWAGREIRIVFTYASDGSDNRPGIWVDDVVVSEAALPVADRQSDACRFVPEVPPPGRPDRFRMVPQPPGLAASRHESGAAWNELLAGRGGQGPGARRRSVPDGDLLQGIFLP